MKIFLLGTFIFAFCLAAAAQAGGGSAPDSSSDMPHATIEGCLRQPVEGIFLLERRYGRSYQLSGDSSKFTALVGHEVRVYGTLQAGGATLPDSMASPDQANAPGDLIGVIKADQIADTCYMDSKLQQNAPTP